MTQLLHHSSSHSPHPDSGPPLRVRADLSSSISCMCPRGSTGFTAFSFCFTGSIDHVTIASLVFGHHSPVSALRLHSPASCAHTSQSSISPPRLLVLICTCCCWGSIRNFSILLVGTVRSGYIKEIRRDQFHERDGLWLTSSETGGGPHRKNKGNHHL